MLILSRNAREKIIIDLGEKGVVEVMIVDIERGKVRLGIEAPHEIPIVRQELLKEKK